MITDGLHYLSVHVLGLCGYRIPIKLNSLSSLSFLPVDSIETPHCESWKMIQIRSSFIRGNFFVLRFRLKFDDD